MNHKRTAHTRDHQRIHFSRCQPLSSVSLAAFNLPLQTGKAHMFDGSLNRPPVHIRGNDFFCDSLLDEPDRSITVIASDIRNPRSFGHQ